MRLLSRRCRAEAPVAPWCARLAACAALVSLAASVATSAPKDAAPKPAVRVVTITVHPVATAASGEVAIGDVATVEGGDAALRNRIARLDLSDAPELGKTARLTQEHISYRIRIAGMDARLYKLQGAPTVAVTSRGYRVPDEELIQAARKFLLARLPWNADDVTIEQSQPIRGPVHVSGGRDDVRLEAKLRGSRLALGNVRVDVTVFSKGAKQAEVTVSFDLHFHQTIVVAARRVERGQPLTKDDVFFERRAVDTVAGYLTESEDPVGQKVKRTILPLQAITKSDFEAAEAETAVVIRQRDMVKLVVRTGGLTVSTTGEALQDGRTGQSIRVRNVDSKAVVVGRVVNRNEVQVLY